jgi:signal transduction histidine kinase
MIGSVVFVAGVIAVGVLESHRTAGAAYAIRRSVDQIRAGQSGVRVRLRRGDHLQALAASVNQLAESLDADRAARS